ncbi:MAG: PKD domain-containing protein [Chloroflexota bacterium]
MGKRRATIALVISVMLATLAPPVVGAAGEPLALPSSMAAVGDSISQAASTGGSLGVDAPQNAWSTGTNSTVASHLQRLQAMGASVTAHNLSVSGAKVAGLYDQMEAAVARQPDYLTVLIGGNDLCTDTTAQMTSVEDFNLQFATAMQTLMDGSPGTYVLVASIPDAYRLWELFRNNYWSRLVWAAGDICQSLLANPGSNQTADVERRAFVRQRNKDYNTAMATVCAQYERCRFDGNAVFNTAFTSSDVSGDYFHPSIAGQKKIAATTWSAGYAWATPPAPPPPDNVAPTAAFTSSCIDLTCTFTDASTDTDGTIATRAWTFGDGGTSTDTNPSRTYAAAGTYAVTLTVTDDDGATGSVSRDVTVTAPPPALPMWVGGLTSTASSSRNTWSATVTVLVTGGAGPVSGVTVGGSWTGASGATSCTTGSDGSCSLGSANVNKKTTSIGFEVTNLTRSGWVYVPDQNITTSLTILKP